MRDKRIIAQERSVTQRKRIGGIAGFLQILREMEENGEVERETRGNVLCPFFAKAAYNCVIRMGIDGMWSKSIDSHKK